MSKVDVAVPMFDSDDGDVGTRRDEVVQETMEEPKDKLGIDSRIIGNQYVYIYIYTHVCVPGLHEAIIYAGLWGKFCLVSSFLWVRDGNT